MRNRLRWWSTLPVLALILTACGPKAEPAEQVVAQELRVNLAGEPQTLDPNRASWAGDLSVISQVFEGLLGFNQDLSIKAVGARDIPSVANNGISADGLTFTFKLRDGVKWSDGQPVTAQNYEYSIKRTLSPELAGEYSFLLMDINGAEAYNGSGAKSPAEQQQLRDAVGVKAVDNSTLQITLARQSFSFLQRMALWPAYPVRQDIIEKAGDQWTEPPTYIGNGPFKLTGWVHQDHLTLEPNPSYWGAKPKLSKIVLKIITDVNTELAAYKNGELEMSRVPPGTEKTILEDPVLSKEVLRYNELVTFAFQFNVTRPPFDNVKVRQAINTAIDREAFINQVRAGVGKAAYSWVPPGMPGHDPELGKQYAFNVARAKQVLAEAGYPDGKGLPPIKFQFADTAGNRVIAQFLQGQMKDNLGISIELDPMEPKAFQQTVNEEKHMWAWFGWGADYPDPDNWLPDIFGTGASINHTLYSNPKFDELKTRALAEPDPARRLDLWKQAHKLVIDDAPIATMNYRERFVLVKPYVKGLKTTSMDHQISGDLFLPGVSLEKH
ncbi:MAG: peptide ABC transporter substrate-binding protein [Chloroflexi bacterium]|nr:peptide ABC transporter substrate-binding protein [Chloroflexota bacterium]